MTTAFWKLLGQPQLVVCLGAYGGTLRAPFMSAYSCRLDVGHEIHHYTEQITGIHISVKGNYAQFSRESPEARYGIQGLNPGRNLSS
jgi:hypothetical protein